MTIAPGASAGQGAAAPGKWPSHTGKSSGYGTWRRKQQPAATAKSQDTEEGTYDWKWNVPWPPYLSHLKVMRGQTFRIYVEDPIDWHRTGAYQYIVVGWDHVAGRYEAWEPSGLQCTRTFSEAEILSAMRARGRGATGEVLVASWADGDLPCLPALERGSARVWPAERDKIFAPQLSGWTPYGTLEMAGPMLFHLASWRAREPARCRSVCDIGAGTGRLATWMSTAWGLDVTAFDIVPPQWPEFDNIQIFDGRRIPLADKSVDAAVFSFVLHHCRHFEIQRALLNEAARVARHWIFISEDTPADERDRKATRGHDRLGTFQDAAAWRAMFRRLKLKIVREGALWIGPKHKPSPYRCTRCYFVLEVPSWLCPPPAAENLPGLAACCAQGADGIARAVADPASLEAAPVEALEDLRSRWFSSSAPDGLQDSPPAWASFGDLRLPDSLSGALEELGFRAPTPIQRVAMPAALSGGDFVGVAATGSGKTLAFLLPNLLRLLSLDRDVRDPHMLVLCPTRELALQITACADALLGSMRSHAEVGPAAALHAVAIWGGGPRWDQLRGLRGEAAIVAATPGRLLDLVVELEEEGRTPLGTVQVLVLDEGDRMLEEGLGDQLQALAYRTNPARQTMFFSATWPEAAGALAQQLCRGGKAPRVCRVGDDDEPRAGRSEAGTADCESGGPAAGAAGAAAIAPAAAAGNIVGNASLLNKKITQLVEVFDQDETDEEREGRKLARLLEHLDDVLRLDGEGDGAGGKALVFCMTKKFADSLISRLDRAGVPAVAVHGNKAQAERIQNLDSFAKGESRVLVATDVLGRGLDIPHVTHVFVFDFPYSVEEYVHRIGRTARGVNGRGQAVAFFEFAPCLPALAGELVAYLEAVEQVVPDELRRVAAAVASGTHAALHRTAASQAADGRDQPSDWMPLARPEELGDAGWHAGGQRSWLLCEQPQAQANAEATGWLVFCSDGKLRTEEGMGTWRISADGKPLILFGDASRRGRRCYELTLHLTWQGRRRLNFTSVRRPEVCMLRDTDSPASAEATAPSAAPLREQDMLIGWVTNSKVYRLR